MADIKQSILEAVGQTPLVELRRVRPVNGSRILVKVEALNPGGSIKTRPACNMVMEAIRRGQLKPGMVIVEATSGNQGVALAMVGAALAYRVRLVMPASMSRERQQLMRAYGAELVLTDPGNDIGEAVRTAREKAAEMAAGDPGMFYVSQFTNEDNPAAHRQATVVEILSQIGDETPVDAFVSGIGSGGTITGCGEVLKGRFPNCRIVAVEPSKAAILAGGAIGNHIQAGIGDGLIPEVLRIGIIDDIVLVTDDEAVAAACRMAREEGLFVGISSGSNVCAALKVAERLGAGKTIVTICPDTGERYLSLGVFGV